MAKITIAGDAVVVTSAMTLEDIRFIERYRPETLTLMGGENNKEPIFKLGTTRGSGNITAFGASFGGETHDNEKLATITMAAAGVGGDIKEWVADNIGAAITKLAALEAALPAVITGIRAERAEVIESITVA